MTPVGSVIPAAHASVLGRIDAPKGLPGLREAGQAAPAANPEGFGQMLDGLVSNVAAKESQAADLTRKVLLGDSDQIHQSVIAMQEASVAFSLMVEVRNKLVESYQELMRMQA